ncbi:hypothetical protein ACFE04_022252 [Oxalis oulophora]
MNIGEPLKAYGFVAKLLLIGNPYMLKSYKKAPKAIMELWKFAKKATGTIDVRINVKLNKHIWSRVIRNVPRRVRVRIACKWNDEEDVKEEFYSCVIVYVYVYRKVSHKEVLLKT